LKPEVVRQDSIGDMPLGLGTGLYDGGLLGVYDWVDRTDEDGGQLLREPLRFGNHMDVPSGPSPGSVLSLHTIEMCRTAPVDQSVDFVDGDRRRECEYYDQKDRWRARKRAKVGGSTTKSDQMDVDAGGEECDDAGE
jgi:hypothetical protein